MTKPRALRLTAHSRPVRAAFLVDPDTLPIEAFDGLVERCMEAWGGGYWPIIPTDGETISDDYWRLLRFTDPDLITSAVDLAPQLQEELKTRFGPATLEVNPVRPEDSNPRVRENWRITPLASVLVLRYHYGRPAVFPSDTPLLWFRERTNERLDFRNRHVRPEFPARRFVQQNFGYPHVSWPLEHELRSLPHREIHLADTPAAEIIRQLTGARYLPYNSLCRLHARRPFEPKYLASPYHAVVVGDSIGDLIRAWNRRVASFPIGQVLWLPTSLAGDHDFLDALSQWAMHVLGDSSNSPRGILVESASVDAAELAPLAQVLKKVQRVSIETYDESGFPFSGRPPYDGPTPFGTNDRQFSDEPRMSVELSSVTDGDEALVSPVVPPFVAVTTKGGAWMVDLDIIDGVAPVRSTNEVRRWRLPRRMELARMFVPRGTYPSVWRIGYTKMPSYSVTVERPMLSIRIPDHWHLASAILAPSHREESSRSSSVRIDYIRPSEQGKRFRAAVGLFGDIYTAGQYLCNSFWRDLLLRAAGDPIASREEQASQALQLLRTERTSSDEELAEKLASVLHRVQRRSGDTIDRAHIKSLYYQAINAAFPNESKENRPSFEEYGWQDFIDLVEWGVFLQGADLRCPICSLTRWHSVDALAREIRCPECLNQFSLPTDPGWAYHLNGLVRTALADEAVLPVIDAAHAIAKEARTHAVVFPPIDLYRSPDDPFADHMGPAFTDLDLFILRDGQLVVGEVKSSARGFSTVQLQTLGAVVAEIRADEVILAAPAESWSEQNESEIKAILTPLIPGDTEIRILQLAPDRFW